MSRRRADGPKRALNVHTEWEGLPGRTVDVQPDRLLNVHEAATMFALKPGTLYQWAYERRIPVVKLSGPRGPLRFRLSTLEEFIRRSERPARR